MNVAAMCISAGVFALVAAFLSGVAVITTPCPPRRMVCAFWGAFVIGAILFSLGVGLQ